jgi:hypothetical protein
MRSRGQRSTAAVLRVAEVISNVDYTPPVVAERACPAERVTALEPASWPSQTLQQQQQQRQQQRWGTLAEAQFERCGDYYRSDANTAT